MRKKSLSEVSTQTMNLKTLEALEMSQIQSILYPFLPLVKLEHQVLNFFWGFYLILVAKVI